jgi:hypothetical protein
LVLLTRLLVNTVTGLNLTHPSRYSRNSTASTGVTGTL